MTIYIYTIGDRVNGFGHVMRELTLASQLITSRFYSVLILLQRRRHGER